MSFKKILAVVMACAMAIGAFAASALTLDVAEAVNETTDEVAVLAAGDSDATNGVASIGDQYYSTVALAMADAKANDTIVIHKDINGTLALTAPTVAPLTFKAATPGIKITGRALLPQTAVSGVVTYDGFDFSGNADWTVQQWDGPEKLNNLELVYKNCSFGKKGICISWHPDKPDWNLKKITLDSCKAFDNKEAFSFQYVDEVVIKNCDFSNATDRIINVSAASGDVTVSECNFGSGSIQLSQNVGTYARNLTVENSTFTGEKAVVIHENLTNAVVKLETVEFVDNTVETTTEIINFKDENVVASDYITNNVSSIIFADNETETGEAVTELADGYTPAAPVAKIGDTYYATFADAVNAATDGAEIVLLADYTGDVTILQKADVDVTLNGNGNKYTGTIYIHGGARYEGAETLTIKNFNFVSDETIDFISSNETGSVERYAHNVTIEDCTFTGAEGVEVVGLRFRQAYDIVVKNCTFTNMHSAAWATGSGPMAFDTVTITNCLNGISVGTVDSVTVTDSTIEAVAEGGYGIRANAEGAYSLTVENTGIKAYYPIIARKATNPGYALNVGEGSTFTATNPDGYDVVVTTGSDDEPFVKPENDVNITIDETVEVNVYSSHVAYADGTYFETLDEALTAAEAVIKGGATTATVKLVSDVAFGNRATDIEPAVDGIVFDLNGYTMTLGGDHVYTKDTTFKNGTIAITDEKAGTGVFWMWNHNNTLTFEDVVIQNAGDSINACGIFTAAPDSHGVTPTDSTGDFVFNNVVINLKNNTFNPAAGGNLFYFQNGTSNVKMVETTITIDSFARGLQYGTYDIDDSEITMTNMNGNAIRRADAVITNSTFIAENTENGMKLDSDNDVVIDGDSYVRFLGATDFDIVVNANSTVAVKDDAVLYADKGNIADASTVTGNAVVLADIIKVDFVQVDGDAEGYDLYNINLVGANDEVINRLNSADLTFVLDATPFTGAAVDYEIIPVKNVTVTPDTTTPNENRFMFNFKGKDLDVIEGADTAKVITIAQVKVSGYGTYTFSVDTAANATNVVHATTISDNIVDTFVPDGATGKGTLDLVDATTGEVTIAVPVRTLTVKVAFPNSVEDNAVLYQDMKVEITGNIDGVHQTVTYDLGGNMVADGTYVVEETRLVLNETYNVVVSGAGYRTARYTVTMTDAKTLNFWNNVKDNAVEVEEGKASSAANKNFLAGDIVGDNQINIYDLSAVVSYFATEITDEADYDKYVKYDLNRDGVIDSKDVAYVLVSWGN